MVKLRIYLLGHPQVIDPSGEVVDIRSKKGIAMLAMLATARQGERSRAWLQEKLWGTRDAAQGKASLRRELANLKKSFGKYSDCIVANNRSIKLDCRKVDIDLLDGPSQGAVGGEFLEGLDIPGEEEFEDWLRETRAHYNHAPQNGDATDVMSAAKVAPLASAPPQNVDVKPSITVLPVRFDQSLSAFEINLMTSMQHRIIRNFTQLRWLHVCLPRDMQPGSVLTSGLAECNGDYKLETHCWIEQDTLHIDFMLLSKRQNRVIWDYSARLDMGTTSETHDETICCCVNMLARQVDLAEQGLALGNGKPEIEVRSALWKLRHYHQRFDTTLTGTIARLIADMGQVGELGNELMLIKAYNLALLIRLGLAPAQQYEDVRRLCREILQLDPNDARGLAIAATVDLWTGNYDQAHSHLAEAIALRPGYALAHGLLGSARYLSGDTDGALASLETAYRIDPMSEYHRFVIGELAIVCAIRGDTVRARSLLRELRTYDPDAELAHFLDFTLYATATEPAQEPLLLCGSQDLKAMLPRVRYWVPYDEILAMEPFRSALIQLEAGA